MCLVNKNFITNIMKIISNSHYYKFCMLKLYNLNYIILTSIFHFSRARTMGGRRWIGFSCWEPCILSFHYSDPEFPVSQTQTCRSSLNFVWLGASELSMTKEVVRCKRSVGGNDFQHSVQVRVKTTFLSKKLLVGHLGKQLTGRAEQIGRASCRERVSSPV